MVRKQRASKATPLTARCYNCQFSPILARFGDNPVIAYCDREGNHEPQVAKRHCCRYWVHDARVKNIEQRIKL